MKSAFSARYLISKIVPDTRCYLIIEFEGETYMGTLLFRDAIFCHQVYELLQKHIARPIKEIGDVDVGYLL